MIVQSHMLNYKGTVRLRRVLSNSGIEGTEDVVLLDNLALTIRDLLATAGASNSDQLAHSREQMALSGQVHQTSIYREGSGTGAGANYRSTSSSASETSIECIYVQHDQFFDSERTASKNDKNQSIKVAKTIRGITQRAEGFVRSMAHPGDGPSSDLPVFVVTDVSYWCLRDFGSRLMRTADQIENLHLWSATQAYQETTDLHPKYKRSLKTLGAAIDSYMKRNGFSKISSIGEKNQSNHHNHGHPEIIFLLYSKVDDRFDMITLQF